MPVRKPSPKSRSFSRVTTNQRTTKRTIRSFSVSISRPSDHHQQSKKLIPLPSKNFPSTNTAVARQKNNSLLRRRRRLLPVVVVGSVRTIARISTAANNNGGCNNGTLLIRSSCSGSRIKWISFFFGSRSEELIRSQSPHFPCKWKLWKKKRNSVPPVFSLRNGRRGVAI